MAVATHDVHEHLYWRFDRACCFRRTRQLLPLVACQSSELRLADGEELVTAECDQCSGHVTDDPRDELLKHRHTAEVSTASAARFPVTPCFGRSLSTRAAWAVDGGVTRRAAVDVGVVVSTAAGTIALGLAALGSWRWAAASLLVGIAAGFAARIWSRRSPTPMPHWMRGALSSANVRVRRAPEDHAAAPAGPARARDWPRGRHSHVAHRCRTRVSRETGVVPAPRLRSRSPPRVPISATQHRSLLERRKAEGHWPRFACLVSWHSECMSARSAPQRPQRLWSFTTGGRDERRHDEPRFTAAGKSHSAKGIEEPQNARPLEVVPSRQLVARGGWETPGPSRDARCVTQRRSGGRSMCSRRMGSRAAGSWPDVSEVSR